MRNYAEWKNQERMGLSKEDTKGILNTREDMGQIVKEIIDEALGLGPLEDLLRDKSSWNDEKDFLDLFQHT